MSDTIRHALEEAARERILVLDGAMGTMIQGLRYDEAQFRGSRFADWKQDVRGNNDLLILTQPDAIRDIHLAYFQAGADIVATNTFSSTSTAQADYGMKPLTKLVCPREQTLTNDVRGNVAVIPPVPATARLN